jgi:hypothetical protein
MENNGVNYGSTQLSALVPEIGDPGIVKMAVQRQPDTRIHCVRSDGTVALLVFDKVESVICWVEIETPGIRIYRRCALRLGKQEDHVLPVRRDRRHHGSILREMGDKAHADPATPCAWPTATSSIAASTRVIPRPISKASKSGGQTDPYPPADTALDTPSTTAVTLDTAINVVRAFTAAQWQAARWSLAGPARHPLAQHTSAPLDSFQPGHAKGPVRPDFQPRRAGIEEGTTVGPTISAPPTITNRSSFRRIGHRCARLCPQCRQALHRLAAT